MKPLSSPTASRSLVLKCVADFAPFAVHTVHGCGPIPLSRPATLPWPSATAVSQKFFDDCPEKSTVPLTGEPGEPGIKPAHSAGGGGGGAANVAETEVSLVTTIMQSPPPLHAPPHVTAPLAVSDTFAPLVNVALHVPGQEMPAGDDVTLPGPLTVTAMVCVVGGGGGGGGYAVNTAVTSASALMFTLHAPVPEHAPCHPVKAKPDAALAVSATEPSSDCWQSALQENDAPCTVPLPEMWIESMCFVLPCDPLPP